MNFRKYPYDELSWPMADFIYLIYICFEAMLFYKISGSNQLAFFGVQALQTMALRNDRCPGCTFVRRANISKRLIRNCVVAFEFVIADLCTAHKHKALLACQND